MIFISLLIYVTVITVTHGRAIQSRTVPIAINSHGDRMFFIREQKNPIIYPHRAMMITGVYQPKHHRSSSRQATGIFAQGDTVSSDAFLGANVPQYRQKNSEITDETGISTVETEASPGPYEIPIIEENRNNSEVENEDDGVHDEENIQIEQEKDESLENSTDKSITEVPIVTEKDIAEHPIKPKVKKPLNKRKKTKNPIDCDDDDENEDYDDDDDYEDDYEDGERVDQRPIFNPWKGKRRGILPLRKNYFPMFFSFPKSYGRGSNSGSSPPGMITAIANSYSTGKGGVASSVATAYGSSPNSKKKLQKRHQE